MIACLHIPDYPAWVMRYRYEDRRIAVYYRGRIVARSWSLRRRIQVGEAVERARASYPEVRFVERDALYEEVRWSEVLERIHALTPLIEPVHPGLVYFQPLEPLSPATLARDLDAQVGAGPTRSIGRIAAARTHAGHLLEIAARGVETFLRATPTKTLLDLGFSEEMVERLELFGLTRFDRIARLSRRHLGAQFGDEGQALFALLERRSDELPIGVFQPPPIVACEHLFEQEAREPAELVPALGVLATRAVEALDGLVCTRMTVETAGRTDGAARLESAVLKEATAEAGVLARAAERLLDRAWPDAPVMLIRLTLASLRPAPTEQGRLFFERPDVRLAIERVHRRYPNAVMRVVPPERSLPLEEADGLPLVPYLSAS